MSIGGIVTFVAGVVLIGAFMAYRSNDTDQPTVQKATKAAIADMKNANASLPKWDNKNYKGLVHRP
jgi:hypothetical protein